jgi:hypothetical protein
MPLKTMNLFNRVPLWGATASVLVCFATCALSSGCNRDPIGEKEVTAIRALRMAAAAESVYFSVHKQYGGLDALKQSRSDGIEEAEKRMRAVGYTLEIQISETAFGLTAWHRDRLRLPYRSFFCDQTGVIRHSMGATLANAGSPRMDGK